MNKIWLILKREYLVRVRKKSFIVMTILGPLLMGGLFFVPFFLANENQEVRIVAINQQDKFSLENTEFLHFTQIPDFEAENLSTNFNESPYYALLYIQEEQFTLYSNQQISLNVSKDIKRQLEKILELKNLKKAGIDPEIIKNAKTNVLITTKIIDKDGESTNSHSEASMGIGFIAGILIYMFIFMYGTMVMRGVIEEKTNRIVEVIISSVKPFQLMMGKILGVALVGLTQFALWITLTIIISTVAEFFGGTLIILESSRTALIESCSVAEIKTGISLLLSARLLDSVPPLVNIISAGETSTTEAILSRASSIALLALRPARWTEEELPKSWNVFCIAVITSGRSMAVAL